MNENKTKSIKKNNISKTSSGNKKVTIQSKTKVSKKTTNTKIVKKTVPAGKKAIVKEKVKEATIVIPKDKVKKELNNSVKLENSKFQSTKNYSLLYLGIILSIIGLGALFISLIANRLVDRDILSDTTITMMISISIIIEGFGAFIIINESDK